MLLSVVVVHYNIGRELPRTLHSFSPAFQQGIDADEYEVIVVDNGSTSLPDLTEARRLGLDVSLLEAPDPTASPARAINLGLNASVGKFVGVFIDGARLASPGLFAKATEALSVIERSVVGTRGRYLGPKAQRESMQEGYSREVEDELLESIDWQRNGYGLFDISVFDESSRPSWFKPPAESNGIFMSRQMWVEHGGYDEAFTQPGGGYANLDVWRRACELPDVEVVMLLGEATFHQLHGGVATNAPEEVPARMRDEYESLRGKPWQTPQRRFRYWGSIDERPPWRELGVTGDERRRIARAWLKRNGNGSNTKSSESTSKL